jgi:predicted Rossmann-fold nucleotide-binding protein
MDNEEKIPFDPEENLRKILESPTYRRAEDDVEFLKSLELRPLRLAMELLKPELVQQKRGIVTTVVLFGGTRILAKDQAEKNLGRAQRALKAAPENPNRLRDVRIAERVVAKSHYYEEARKFAQMAPFQGERIGVKEFVIVTGGGPGIMEAGNRGASDVGALSIGLNITLPHEQVPNAYITPELCFQFHYFAIRKIRPKS